MAFAGTLDATGEVAAHVNPLPLIPAFVIGLLSPNDGLQGALRGYLGADVAVALIAVATAESSAEPDAPAAPTPAGEGLATPVDKQLTFARLHLPKGFGASAGRCDLLIHFHGAPQTTIPAFDHAGLQAALLLVNLGAWADPYASAYADPAAFPRLAAAAQKSLDEALPESERCPVARIGLSAYSAGYAAVSRILSSADNVARIDAVLLADALHAPFELYSRRPDARGMTGITRFGKLATEGDRMLSVTHSSIETHAFASTSKTAAALLDSLGVERVSNASVGPRGMSMTYRADKRGLHVRGYRGDDASAHSDQLRAIGDTLFPELRERWERR